MCSPVSQRKGHTQINGAQLILNDKLQIILKNKL